MNSVELIGYYGGDLEHALSAWTSTSRDLTDEKRARVPQLLKKLAEDGHHTPFEKSALHFLVSCETATHIHILKHRIGVSVNGESARYKELREDRAYVPRDWDVSSDNLTLADWAHRLREHTRRGQNLYHQALEELTPLLGRKRAKESARFFLGYNNVTTMDVMFNWRSFMHFVGLRADDHAQDEVHWVADEMLRLVREMPGAPFRHSLEAFGR